MQRFQHPQGNVFYRKMGHARPSISHGSGIFLYDTDGKEYIDASGGPMVINVGHGREEIISAISDQASRVGYAHAVMFTSDVVETYSAEIAPHLPLENPRLFYLSSGSEVVEAANKLARQIQQARGFPNKNLIISRTQSYHGMTLGALASSGRPGLRNPFLGMLKDMPHITPPYPYRDPVSGIGAADRLEAKIREVGAENVAAFLAEPISGASLGAVMPSPDYWLRIRDICDTHGVLLIADEVLVGMGRTGKWWGINHYNIQPDILVASKGTAGGYIPHGFVAAKHADVDRIRTELGDFNHGGTFSHHPIAGAAALATLRVIKTDSLVENAQKVGAYLGDQLQTTFADHPHIGDIRGTGLFWGIEFVQDKATKAPFPAQNHLAWDIWQAAFERGLIVYYSQGCADGSNGDLIMLGPPLIISKPEIDTVITRLDDAIQAVLPVSADT